MAFQKDTMHSDDKTDEAVEHQRECRRVKAVVLNKKKEGSGVTYCIKE
jgi:hypothetical protein